MLKNSELCGGYRVLPKTPRALRHDVTEEGRLAGLLAGQGGGGGVDGGEVYDDYRS